MMPTSPLLARARLLLGRHLILWVPTVLAQTVQAAGSLPASQRGVQYLVLLAALLASGLIEGGQTAMIAQAWGPAGAAAAQPAKAERPTWGRFAEAINARWGTLLAGQLAFLALLIAVGGAFVGVGAWRLGTETVTAWIMEISKLKPEALPAALSPDAIPLAVLEWGALFSLMMLVMSVVAGLLLFWQPLAVVRGLTAPRAFLESAKLVFRRFKLVMGLASVQALFTIVTLVGAAGGPVAALVGMALLLAVSVYFKIAYTAVVIEDAEPLPAEG